MVGLVVSMTSVPDQTGTKDCMIEIASHIREITSIFRRCAFLRTRLYGFWILHLNPLSSCG
jgi:hypothetical protein